MNESLRELLRAQQERSDSLNFSQNSQHTHQTLQQLNSQGLNQTATAALLSRSRSPQHAPALGFDICGSTMPNSLESEYNSSLSLSNEIKRLQQLQQLASSGGSATNPLLYSQHRQLQQLDPPMDSALLQHYFMQKVQAPRFEQQSLLGSAHSSFQGLTGNSSRPLLESQLFQEAQMLMRRQSLNQQLGTSSANSLVNSITGTTWAPPQAVFQRDGSRRMRGGVIEPFPEKLHRLLLEVEASGRSDVISFVSDGRAFAIHKSDIFFTEIVPLYFRQSRLSSFKRQLNLYGFELINTGPNRGAYYHEFFQRDQPELCRRMRRVAVKVNAKSTNDDAEKDKKAEESGDECESTTGDKAEND